MAKRRRLPALAVPLICAGAMLSGCAEDPVADTPRIEGRTFSLKPAKVAARIGLLDSEMSDLFVILRVNAETKDVIYAPQLHGTLKVKNSSPDEPVRLLNGQIEYLDGSGNVIGLTPDRADSSFWLNSYAIDRIEPGGEITHRLDVPFPLAALKGKMLSEIRLKLTYLPAPYREEAVEIPVALATR